MQFPIAIIEPDFVRHMTDESLLQAQLLHVHHSQHADDATGNHWRKKESHHNP